MNWLMIPTIVILAAATVQGGTGDSACYVMAGRDARPVSVVLVRTADCVAVAVSIVSEQKQAAQRFEAIRAAKRLIQHQAGQHGKIRLKDGPLSVSARPYAKASLLSMSSYSSYESPSAAHLTILLALDPRAPDALAAAGEITRFIGGISFAEKTRCQLGPVELAVTDPEQYRAGLLQRLAEEIRQTRQQLGGKGTLTVDGLQSPVLVRKLDETQVELFLGYTVTLSGLE